MGLNIQLQWWKMEVCGPGDRVKEDFLGMEIARVTQSQLKFLKLQKEYTELRK